MKKIITVLTLILFIFSCEKNVDNKNLETNTKKEESITKETIVTTLPPLKWLVSQIAGEEFNVISIIQPNMNHELFEPKPEDLKTLENSKLLFSYNALSFEEKISDSVATKDKVVNILENIDEKLLLENHDHHEHEHSHDHKNEHNHHHDEEFDPHVWFSLEIMPITAENIKNKLISVYPDKKETFEKNYNNFIEQLNNFKAETDKLMASKTKKYYMIYHPALNYFIKNYNIKEIAVEYQGKEPSAKQIKEIIDETKEHNITTILVQPQFPKQSIETISKEIPNSKIVEFNADEENIFENLKKFVNSID